MEDIILVKPLPLAPLASCPNLVSLSLNLTLNSRGSLLLSEVSVISQLQGLTQLTLTACPAADYFQQMSLCFLSVLTNLQQLTAAALYPLPPYMEVSAPLGGQQVQEGQQQQQQQQGEQQEGEQQGQQQEGEQQKGEQKGQQQEGEQQEGEQQGEQQGFLLCCLPGSLTSLTFEGTAPPESGLDNAMVRSWWPHLQSATSLQKLQLIKFDTCNNLFQGGWGEGGLEGLADAQWEDPLDFAVVAPHLREFHCTLTSEQGLCFPLPPSLSLLTNLEVLRVETHKPREHWQRHVVDCFAPPSCKGLLESCVKLRELGCLGGMVVADFNHVAGWQDELQPDFTAELIAAKVKCNQLTKLHVAELAGDGIPAWVCPAICPQLQHLVVEMSEGRWPYREELSALTSLTCLSLDAGRNPQQPATDSGLGLVELGRSLTQLQRLELVNYTAPLDLVSADLGNDSGVKYKRCLADMKLAVPDLSSFSQLKQLQLKCVMHRAYGSREGEIPYAEQPRQQEFYERLLPLTGLEELELIGYSTVSAVSPGLVGGLIDQLQQLQVVEVGMCKHPSLSVEQLAADEEGFRKVQETVRSGVSLRVGVARQWLD